LLDGVIDSTATSSAKKTLAWNPPTLGALSSTQKPWRTNMPAVSKSQQKAAGAALSAKRGEIPKSKLVGASIEMYDSMSEAELDKMASVKRASLPDKKS
jgi:hypothetical protein